MVQQITFEERVRRDALLVEKYSPILTLVTLPSWSDSRVLLLDSPGGQK